jgi:release factor glutamine methyltransferase
VSTDPLKSGGRPAELLTAGIQRLAVAGLVSPRADARILLAAAAGLEPGQLAVTARLDDATATRYARLIERRAAGEPVQYLTGQAWFRNVRVAVGPGVLIPRPETEQVVEAALDLLRSMHRMCPNEVPVVVDLGTGSGAMAAAIVGEYTNPIQVVAVENAPAALPWAARNLADTGVRLVEGDFRSALPELDGQVWLVMANPPYLPEGDAPALPGDVTMHEPREALFAGPDGLDAIRVVIVRAAQLLKSGGWLVMEHDESHGEIVPRLLAELGYFEDVADHQDLTGRPRFVTARRAETP